MDGSGSVVFPHCACDSRKEGRVIPVVSFEGFRLQACMEDGTKEVRETFDEKFSGFNRLKIYKCTGIT